MAKVKILLASVMWYLASGGAAAYAGAWTQEPGSGQAILNLSVYATDRYYDNQKKRRSQQSYQKYELNPYVEYGVLDGVTVGGNVSLQYTEQRVGGTGWVSYGLGDTELFARARLWQYQGFVISAEPMVKLPNPWARDLTPRLGGAHPDAGLGLAAGYGFGSDERHHFVDLYLGYRYRLGDPHDQVKAAATLGYSLTPRWMAMPQLFITKRRGAPTMPAFTFSSNDDYDLVKAQFSAVYRLSSRASLQGAVFTHADGRNTGAGNGALISLWRKF